MKKLVSIIFVCLLVLVLNYAKAASDESSEVKTGRSYIDPFLNVMAYETLGRGTPEVLALPASWEYSDGKRCLQIGDNIVCIRRVPVRSAWKPSF